MIGKVESNTESLARTGIITIIMGVIIGGLGIAIFIFKLIATPSFGFFIAALGIMCVLIGLYFLRTINAYSIELYPDYFIVRKKKKETRIEKNTIENFYIQEETQGSRYLKYKTYTLCIEQGGKTYYFDPKKYKDVFEKMCAYYGVLPEEAVQKEKGLWEMIKKTLIIEE